MNTYSDEYVEAIITKWTKMLPITQNLEFRSNVALALENQYNYHKKLNVSLELTKKLASISFRILPKYFQMMQGFSYFHQYYSVYSEDELLRVQNKVWSGTEPEQKQLGTVSVDFENLENFDFADIAYQLFIQTKEIILSETIKNINRVYQRNNLKLDRKVQFVYSKLKSENCVPDIMIKNTENRNWIGKHVPIMNGDDLMFDVYKTSNKAIKNKVIIGNHDDITFYSCVPIRFDSKDLKRLESNTLMNKFIKINTDGFVQIGLNPSLALIEE